MQLIKYMCLVTLMHRSFYSWVKSPPYQSSFHNDCSFTFFMFYEEDAGMAYCCLHHSNNESLLHRMLTFLYIFVL